MRVLVPGFPVLWQAIPAVYRPSFGGDERYFAFLSTVRTNGLCHCPGPVEPSPKTSVIHFHYLCSYYPAGKRVSGMYI
jgi:hypothetical protein